MCFTNSICVFCFLGSLSLTDSFRNSLKTCTKLRIQCPKIVAGGGWQIKRGVRCENGGNSAMVVGGIDAPANFLPYRIVSSNYTYVTSAYVSNCCRTDDWIGVQWRCSVWHMSRCSWAHTEWWAETGVRQSKPKRGSEANRSVLLRGRHDDVCLTGLLFLFSSSL